MKIKIVFVNIDSLYLRKRFLIVMQTFSIIYANVYIVFERLKHIVRRFCFTEQFDVSGILFKIKLRLQCKSLINQL